MSVVPEQGWMPASVPDPVAVAASEVIGGPRGRYAASPATDARPGRRVLPWGLTAAWVALMAAVPAVVGVALRVPCLRDGWSPRTADQYWHMCYADAPMTWRSGAVRDLGAWFGGHGATASEPPLLSLLMSLVGSLVPSGGDLPPAIRDGMQVRWYFALWALAITVCVIVTAVLVAATLPAHHRWHAAHVALAPVVALAAYIAPDMVGVALATAGLWAWQRQRLALAGVLLGLGITTRFYPVLILAAIGLVAWRTRRLREAAATAGVALVTTGGVWLVTLALSPGTAGAAISRWFVTTAGYGSPWYLPNLAGGGLSPAVVTMLAVLGWIVALGAAAYLVIGAPVPPSVAEVSLVIVGIVLVTGKTFTVQSSLWLVPLVALSLLPWRDHLVWAGAEVLHFGAVWLTIAGTSVPNRGLPGAWYAVFLCLRMAAVVWLVAMVWLTARGRRAGDFRVASPTR